MEFNTIHNRSGRYVAYYNEVRRRWEVRVIDAYGRLGMPAEGPLPGISYTDCVRTIHRLEANAAIYGRKL
jgi:hypothetical protein